MEEGGLIMIASDRIHLVRRERKVSAGDLSEAMGISRTRLSAWENQRGLPDAENLYKLCVALNVSADYLLGLDITLASRELRGMDVIRESPSAHDMRPKRPDRDAGIAARSNDLVPVGPVAEALRAIQSQLDQMAADAASTTARLAALEAREPKQKPRGQRAS